MEPHSTLSTLHRTAARSWLIMALAVCIDMRRHGTNKPPARQTAASFSLFPAPPAPPAPRPQLHLNFCSLCSPFGRTDSENSPLSFWLLLFRFFFLSSLSLPFGYNSIRSLAILVSSHVHGELIYCSDRRWWSFCSADCVSIGINCKLSYNLIH